MNNFYEGIWHLVGCRICGWVTTKKYASRHDGMCRPCVIITANQNRQERTQEGAK